MRPWDIHLRVSSEDWELRLPVNEDGVYGHKTYSGHLGDGVPVPDFENLDDQAFETAEDMLRAAHDGRKYLDRLGDEVDNGVPPYGPHGINLMALLQRQGVTPIQLAASLEELPLGDFDFERVKELLWGWDEITVSELRAWADVLGVSTDELLGRQVPWRPMDTAPWDTFVLLRVPSGCRSPALDIVQCTRHSSGYRGGAWVDAQQYRLTDSHVDEPTGWLPVSVLP